MKRKLFTILRLQISIALVLSFLCGLRVHINAGETAKNENNLKRKFILAPSVLPAGAPRRKLALLVGINNYAKTGKNSADGWWNLNTKGDVELLAQVLISKFKFKAEDIKILCDQEVTVDGKKILPVVPTHKLIVDTFRSFLIAQVKEGDVAYFHFSGHGQQVPDDDQHGPNPIVGDELDGYDETIIPADYVSQKDGSKNIRDDEIGQLLDELSAKKPANVTISLDSCFSGTATRGELSRGAEWKGTAVDKKMIRGEDEDAADFVTRGGNRGGNGEQNYVFISAASQKQTAKEVTQNGQKYGAFTYALANAMTNSGEKTTYRDLFQKVTSAIPSSSNQNPQMEGIEIDKILMEDGALPPQRFVNVRFSPQGVPFLDAGKLQGLTKGSKFSLCVVDAKECSDKDKIVSGEIDSVNPTTSTIRLENAAVAPEKLKTALRAFEIFHNYEDLLKVSVKENGRGGSFKLNTVFTELGLGKTVSTEEGTWNIQIRSSDETDVKEGKVAADFRGLILERPDRSIIKTIPENTSDADRQIRNALLAEANLLTIQSLGATSDANLVNLIKLELVPLENKVAPITGEALGFQDMPKEKLYTKDGKVQLKAGDFVRLDITNTGQEDLYVTVLDIQPDGKIGPGFPSKGKLPGSGNSDNLIPADGKAHQTTVFKITEPFGQESFQAIVTKTPTDFTPLLSPELIGRGSLDVRGQNAYDSPLGKILMNSNLGKRGDVVQPPAMWATTSLNFFVIPVNEQK